MAVAVKGSWAKPSSGSRFLLPYVVCPAGTASGGTGTLIEHEGIPVSIKCMMTRYYVDTLEINIAGVSCVARFVCVSGHFFFFLLCLNSSSCVFK